MKRALLHAVKNVRTSEVDRPEPGQGEVLIRTTYAGVCGSDISLYLGHRAVPSFPHSLGHEIVGRIEAVGGGVSPERIGQRVVVEPNYPCGACEYCLSGRGNICPNKKSPGISLPGFFAEFCVAPSAFAWPIGEELRDVDAAVIEPLAVAVHALRDAGLGLGDTVAVVGCGAIGLLLCYAAGAQGIRVLAHEKVDRKSAMAVDFGAEIQTGEEWDAVWKREGVTTVFDTTGVSATVDKALASAPRGSQVVLLGLSTESASFVPLRFVREGISLKGSLIYDHPSEFPRVISLVSRGLLHPSRIITNSFPLEEIDQAFAVACSGEAAKVLVKF